MESAWTAGRGALGRLHVARFESTGDVDSNFPNGALLSYTPFANVHTTATTMALQSDGKIVLGRYTNSADRDFAVVRLLANGLLDTTFDGDGLATTQLGTAFDEVRGVTVQADGKIVAAGGANSSPAVVRYNADGSLDSGFDGDGKAMPLVSGFFGAVGGVVLQGDGAMVTPFGLSVMRLASSGAVDAGFGTSDVAKPTFVGSLNDTARQVVARQGDGKLVVAGFSELSGNQLVALARYNLDGTLDHAFGSNGRVTTDFGVNEQARSLAILGNGDNRLHVAGDVATPVYVVGGSGGDHIQTATGDDTIYAGDGNDLVQSGGGNDFVDGGAGNDQLQTTAGHNILLGGPGDDFVQGGTGRDLIIGGAGGDRLMGRDDDDILIAGHTDHDGNLTG